MTTIHAQDFKDVDGDRAIGRKAIPMSLSSCGQCACAYSGGSIWRVAQRSCSSRPLLACNTSVEQP
ncbi:hypothetical protein C8Q80DRAFT_1152376 [Daedaleopsis nitida]|nr:hypothetical protein C8Q80DRAFT_1152376 [Daedaleopsis nitida]